MDGRVLVLLLAEVVPAALIGVTIWEFASNPIGLLALLTTMVLGAFYILSYAESF
ncbi:MAG TPA: hypothetical protein VMH78_08185 [Thermoplasmata archaeon]|nr:hypothetical protein [Thermoplasmata archaeon]